ncbi:MAG: hypothetical protein KBA30_01490 [Clostridia bacterium]|nr:hypothetical protein [Clostridia bacterium]
MKRKALILLLVLAFTTAGFGTATPVTATSGPGRDGLYYLSAPRRTPPVIRAAEPPARPQNQEGTGNLATDLFGTTTSGGTGAVVDTVAGHFEDKYTAIRDSYNATAKTYERAFNTSGKDKAFWRWQKAQDAATKAGSSANAIKLGSTGYSIYSIYRDCSTYNDPSKHNHSSLALLDRTLRGFSIISSTLDLFKVPHAKPLALGGGVLKEVVGGETFSGWANQQDNFVLYGLDTTTDWVNDLAYQAFLRYWFGIYNDTENANLHGRPPYGTGVYKPNIYLYPESSQEVTVTFGLPALLTVTIPDYTGIWTVTAEPDGTQTDADGREYGYLFYESETDPALFSYDQGWLVPAAERESVFRTVLGAYGFNARETEDFIDFWVSRLEPGMDYRMIPQGTARVDAAMPVTVSPAPESVFRLWFAFEPWDGGTAPAEPAIDPIPRDGFTLVEWGGFILD